MGGTDSPRRKRGYGLQGPHCSPHPLVCKCLANSLVSKRWTKPDSSKQTFVAFHVISVGYILEYSIFVNLSVT